MVLLNVWELSQFIWWLKQIDVPYIQIPTVMHYAIFKPPVQSVT